jgi:hypothetical protein
MEEKEDPFAMPVSVIVRKVMYNVMKHAANVKQGVLNYEHRTIMKGHLDEDECTKLLESMCISKENVLRYLEHKYIPTWIEGGARFLGQTCIQSCTIKKDPETGLDFVTIHIRNSEPHKIITDSIHIFKLMNEHGLNPPNRIKFFIEQCKIAFNDVMLYNLVLKE